jgi:hypothetical protein
MVCFIGFVVDVYWLGNFANGSKDGLSPLGWISSDAINPILGAIILLVALDVSTLVIGSTANNA